MLKGHGFSPLPLGYEEQYRKMLTRYPRRQPIYGFELEIGAANQESFNKAVELCGYAGMRRDTSGTAKLSQGPVRNPAACSDPTTGRLGIEFKWWPAVLPTHRRKLYAFAQHFGGKEGFAEAFTKDGEGLTNSLGLHVHVSRSVLTRGQRRALVCLWHWFARERDFTRLVGRGPNMWCSALANIKLTSPSHYFNARNAACISHTKPTVEVRLPASSRHLDVILGRLELVEATTAYVCKYVKEGPVSVSRLQDFEQFCKFVGSRKHHWPMLTHLWEQRVRENTHMRLFADARRSNARLFT